MRSDARDAAFKIVFAELFGGDCDGTFKASVCKKCGLSLQDAAFTSRLVSLVEKNKEALLGVLSEKVTHYPEARIYPVDKAILLVALAEILYLDEVPPAVSASEAAALATKYSTDNSPAFITGVLGSVIEN